MKNIVPMTSRVTTALICLAMLVVGVQPGNAQKAGTTPSAEETKRIEKVKNDVRKIGLGGDITVSRVDNRDFFGEVFKIDSDDFQVSDADSNVMHVFKYSDIKNVRKGKGNVNRLSGKRDNSRTRRTLGWIGGGILAGVVVFVLVGLSDDGN